MKKFRYITLLFALSTAMVLASPNGSYSKTGPKGHGQANANVQSGKGRYKASGNATYSGKNGANAQAQGSASGSKVQGSGGGTANWKGPKGTTGSAQNQFQYKNGTVDSNSNWESTSANGTTRSGSSSTTYNKDSGGTTTVNTANGTKTVDLPPADGSNKP